MNHFEKQLEQKPILNESNDETENYNSSDFDCDLIFGVLGRAADAEVNVVDNRIPECSKHSDDSTITLSIASNGESMLDAQVEGEHLNISSNVEGSILSRGRIVE